LLLEIAAKVRRVRAPDRGSHFLDPQRGVLEHVLRLGDARLPNKSLHRSACLFFEKMLEAGGAEAQSRGKMFHRMRLFEVACDNLKYTQDPFVRSGQAGALLRTQRRWGKSKNEWDANHGGDRRLVGAAEHGKSSGKKFQAGARSERSLPREGA